MWFHHIKSLEKRKEIVSLARCSGLRGFCKPGFPGVVAIEGKDDECDAFVEALRGLRWQAMDVRWEQRYESPPTERLPDPFVELQETALGEAAAFCKSAGIEQPFRATILKIGGSGGVATDAPPRATVEDAVDQECVVHIDHMNDAEGYTKLLHRWTSQLGVTAWLIFANGRRSSIKPPASRVTNVFCVLRGPMTSVKAFLQRLRTQMVDVDKSGRPCKERQATVHWQERAAPWSAEARLPPAGDMQVVECAPCSDSAQLRVALAACGIEASKLAQLLSPRHKPHDIHSHTNCAPRGGKK